MPKTLHCLVGCGILFMCRAAQYKRGSQIVDNNPTESPTLDAAIEYLTNLALLDTLAALNSNGQVLLDLHYLREIKAGYTFDSLTRP